MNADELLKKLIASGADESGIRDRFNDNTELYDRCFRDFIEEPNFVLLRDAMNTRNYDQAFEAAHALKGLSGNLGVSGFYNAIRALVEALREKCYARANAEYAEVEREHEKLKRLLTDEAQPCAALKSAGTADKSTPDTEETSTGLKRKNSRMLVFLLCAAVAAISIVGALFCRMNIMHKQKVIDESGQHLMEISNQLRLYIEAHIATDWKIAQSVGDSMMDNVYENNDSAVLNMLRRKQALWDVSDLMLYTESGYCVYADGGTETNDTASETVYSARTSGKYMSVIDSKIIYTIPLETEQKYAGERIVAVSVVRDMSSFLDDMEFSSFGGAAWMYLTDQRGILISALTNPSTVKAFNIQAVIKGMEITPLDKDDAPEEFLSDPSVAAFLLSNGSEKMYGVSIPVSTCAQPFHLFYFVPENVVNSTMNGFSKTLISFSMAIIFLFAVCAFLASLFVYKSRKKLFDHAILVRERMFDLLVGNTKTAFGLFSVGQPKPAYVSGNTELVMGDRFWVVDRTPSGYRVRNDQGSETDSITEINKALAQWDGKSTFRSGFLRNTRAATPTFFAFELYPIEGDENSFVSIAQDVTQSYARQEATKNAMEMATRSNEAKTRFLSNMSHDIRTPMNAIINMTNFALESVDQPKKLGAYLHVIRESAEHLLHLINDVLDVSRIESGHLVLATAPFEIRAEMQRQVDMIRPLCQAKGQTLMTDFSGIEDATVCGDALKLSQIIMNLLSNAVKFTPERGAIRFIAREIPSLRDNILNVRFTVEDTGIGISDEDNKRIFEPFSRANDKAVSKIEGTGLGLSICKSYIDAMGGTIRCDSEQGEGSIFTVELFFQKSNCSAGASGAGRALSGSSFLGMRALVAEDNSTNQLIAKELLERIGFIVDFAEDGGETVRKFLSAKPDTYDVIYMDIQMPVMDGYEATAKIRASHHAQALSIPIIAMTANAFAEDIEKARVAGMDAYVDKPIVSFNLVEQTAKAIQRKKGQKL